MSHPSAEEENRQLRECFCIRVLCAVISEIVQQYRGKLTRQITNLKT
jgi:hypothetical protein